MTLDRRPPVTTWQGWLRLPGWIVATLARELLIEPWRTGALSWRGRPASERVVLGTVTVLFVACVAVIAGATPLRRSTTMVAWAAPDGDLVSVPVWVMFLVSVTLAVALAAMLTWSVVARPLMRVAMVAGYATIPMLLVSFCWATASPWRSVVAAVLFAVPAVLVFVPARRRPDPAVVFALSSMCIAAGIAAVWWALSTFAAGLLPLEPVALVLSLLVTLLPAAAAPVAFAAALATVDFGVTAASAAIGLGTRFLGRFLAVGVVGLIAWRITDAVRATPGGWSAVGHSAVLVVVLGAVWFGCGAFGRRRAVAGSTSLARELVAIRPLAFNVGFGMLVPLFAAAFAYLVAASLGVLVPGSRAATRLADAGSWLADDTTTLVVRGLVAVALGAVTSYYVRTGRVRLAQWSAMFAVVLAVSLLTARGALLERWRWSEVGLDRAMLLAIVGLLIVQTARGAVSRELAVHAGAFVVVGALFSQSDFVSDPLAAFFGFAGLGFLVFGLVWGFVTGGAGIASPQPAEATALLLGVLGRSLFSVVVVAWAVAARQTDLAGQLPAFSELGRSIVGIGLLVGVSLWLFGAAAGWDTDPLAEPDPDPDLAPAGQPAG